jgi:hypothetical protein
MFNGKRRSCLIKKPESKNLVILSLSASTFLLFFAGVIVNIVHLIIIGRRHVVFTTILYSPLPRINACSISPSHGLFLIWRGENIFCFTTQVLLIFACVVFASV